MGMHDGKVSYSLLELVHNLITRQGSGMKGQYNKSPSSADVKNAWSYTSIP
jgi:hypothetical protein